MTLVYKGKTKDVYQNPDGTYTLKMKDTATGKDGVFDPGENAVGLSIDGLGRESLMLTEYFFKLLTSKGIPNHYISCDIANTSMTVIPAPPIGNLEFICRVKADGSFLRRYGAYAAHGQDLNCLVEVTIKDDMRGDPPINQDALITLGILTQDDYQTCVNLTQQITKLIHAQLANKGLELYDIKYEFGKNGDEIILIDEFSAGVMRVYKGDKQVPPMELASLIL